MPSDAAAKGVKLERYASGGALLLRRVASGKFVSASSHLLFRATVLATLALVFLFALHYPSLLSRSFSLASDGSSSSVPGASRSHASHRSLLASSSAAATYGGERWQKEIRRSAKPRRDGGLSVLVTGAGGFVGAHCSLALKARGDGVVGLDNFNSYYDPALKRGRQQLLADRGVVVLDADINDALLLERLFEAVPFTHVLHLAAQAGVRYAMEAPQTYVASNVAGLVSVFEAAAKHADPQPAVVWASSSSVYGLNTDAPFSEDHRTDRPASLYAATKKAGEAIAHAYNHIYGLSITGLRFFTVYGPWGRPDMAYFSFARSIVAGEPITLYADARRDFTYIDDVVKGCVGALDTAGRSTGSARSGKKSGPAPLRVYNLGNTSPVPVTRMVAILEKLLGKKANKRIIAMPSNGDVPFTHANVSHAAHDFGYRPTTSLDAGLRHFVDWFVQYYKLDIKIAKPSTTSKKPATATKKKASTMSAASS
ncbi:UDP-glucuronate 4-epimerase 6-like [Triticum urartu]|uniref:UDP-glucuronate 4-epimerase n=1 Tax=Triticum urartu TaxID=4572 RepID=A0A8R7QG93_TRIUA|nr:UDP-glucuronate 4-epimerase 6-like [Triticum dicoccoides]XP_048530933.1 UDP-glucuronate 4-epimerase 6-like [Triticum urartu]